MSLKRLKLVWMVLSARSVVVVTHDKMDEQQMIQNLDYLATAFNGVAAALHTVKPGKFRPWFFWLATAFWGLMLANGFSEIKGDYIFVLAMAVVFWLAIGFVFWLIERFAALFLKPTWAEWETDKDLKAWAKATDRMMVKYLSLGRLVRMYKRDRRE